MRLGINAAFHGCIRVHTIDEHTWVKMTLSIEDMLKSKENTTAPRFQWREAGAEGMSPVESVTISQLSQVRVW